MLSKTSLFKIFGATVFATTYVVASDYSPTGDSKSSTSDYEDYPLSEPTTPEDPSYPQAYIGSLKEKGTHGFTWFQYVPDEGQTNEDEIRENEIIFPNTMPPRPISPNVCFEPFAGVDSFSSSLLIDTRSDSEQPSLQKEIDETETPSSLPDVQSVGTTEDLE
jgi:hypothetical protein